MEKLIYKKLEPDAERTVVWPVTITRAIDGGKTQELLVDVRYGFAVPDELSAATVQAAMRGLDADVIVYDRTVRGFPCLPGGEAMSDADLVAAFRKDAEVMKGVAQGYFAMLNGRAAKN